MIYEIATITVVAGSESDFIAGVAKARPVFGLAKGFVSLAVQRSIERPATFHVVIGWDSVEDHVVGFRGSAGFARWRECVGPFFAAPPVVEHVEMVDLGPVIDIGPGDRDADVRVAD